VVIRVDVVPGRVAIVAVPRGDGMGRAVDLDGEAAGTPRAGVPATVIPCWVAEIPATAETLKPAHCPAAACLKMAAEAALICCRLYRRCWTPAVMPRRAPSAMIAVSRCVRGPYHMIVVALRARLSMEPT
jgi:hypothetical protein